METGERPLYVYPADHHRVIVWRTRLATWVLMPCDGHVTALQHAAETRALLTPAELRQLRSAYGASTQYEMAALVMAFPCRMCFVPAALRPPDLPWPDHEQHARWQAELAAVPAV